MRSLSMRIANPHLIPKKSRFGYQTKKSKLLKNKNLLSEAEVSKAIEPEMQSLMTSDAQSKVKKDKLVAIEEDPEKQNNTNVQLNRVKSVKI